MPLAASSPDIVFLFSSAGLVLYVASRAAVDALTATDDPLPGRMAFAQWVPIAWAAILAAAAGHTDIAITLIFATSVTVLALDLGVLTILSPRQDIVLRNARVWPLLIPAAMLPLLAGFSSTLTWIHACMMILLGFAVAGAWRACESIPDAVYVRPLARSDPPDKSATNPPGGFPVVPVAVGRGAVAPMPQTGTTTRRPIRLVQLIISILLAGVGGWIAVLAILATGQRSRSVLATAIISPLLTLPVLGTGAIAAGNRKMGAVTANLVGIVLLNLCALLPAVIFISYIRQAIDLARPTFATTAIMSPAATSRPANSETSPTTAPSPAITDVSSQQLQPVHFPIAVWRIDCILVMALGLLLIPISLGRWTLERSEGLALAFGYIAYLIASAALAMRL